jgi:autonomous glycyl radical cofactor GrcA
MEPKNFSTINLTQKEIKDIQQFCNLNKIEDIPTFLHACTWKGYEVEKFGLLGNMGGIQEKRVEIEVIREKRVEIPVEVIKEVVKIEYVEVPVEVIKEVVVEKTTTDNSKQKTLEETIQKIRTELQLKNKEINDLKNTITEIQTSNGRQGIFLDGSNLNRTINNRK